MKHSLPHILLASVALLTALALPYGAGAQVAPPQDPAADFRTASRCITCHNNLKTAKGEDVSIGMEWRAASWLMRRAILTGRAACAARHSTIPSRVPRSRLSAQAATCPCNTPGQGAGPSHRSLQAASAPARSCRRCGGSRRCLLHGLPPIQSQAWEPRDYSGTSPSLRRNHPARLRPFPEDPDASPRCTSLIRLRAIQSDHIRQAASAQLPHALYPDARA